MVKLKIYSDFSLLKNYLLIWHWTIRSIISETIFLWWRLHKDENFQLLGKLIKLIMVHLETVMMLSCHLKHIIIAIVHRSKCFTIELILKIQ